MIFIHDLEGWHEKPKPSNIININWDIINKFNEISYDRIGLIIDVKRTKENLVMLNSEYYYKLELRSLDYHYYHRSDHSVGFDYKEDRLQNCADSVVNSYYDKMDNQGNIEFTPLLQLGYNIRNVIWSPYSNCEISQAISDLVTERIKILKNELHCGLSNVVRY